MTAAGALRTGSENARVRVLLIAERYGASLADGQENGSSMRRSVIRSVVALLMLASVALVAFAGPASAKGKPVTITLTCTSEASWVNASVQMRMGDLSSGVDVGDPIAINCGPASESGQMTNTVERQHLPDKSDGFIVFYSYGPTTADPNGATPETFISGARDTTQQIFDSGPTLIATVTVV